MGNSHNRLGSEADGGPMPVPAEAIEKMRQRVHMTWQLIEESRQASSHAWLPVTSLVAEVCEAHARSSGRDTSSLKFCDVAGVWQMLRCPYARACNDCTITGHTFFCMLEKLSKTVVSVVDSNVPSMGGMSTPEVLWTWKGDVEALPALIEAVRVFAILNTLVYEGHTGVDDEALCQGRFNCTYVDSLSKSSGLQMCLLKEGAVYADIVAKDLRLHLASIVEAKAVSPVSAVFIGSLNSYQRPSKKVDLEGDALSVSRKVRGLAKKLNLTSPGADFQAWAEEIEAMVDDQLLPLVEGSTPFIFGDVLCARCGEQSGTLLLRFVHDVADHLQLPIHLSANMGALLYFKNRGYELRLNDKAPILPFDDLHITNSDLRGDFFQEDKLKRDFAALNVSCARTAEEAEQYVALMRTHYGAAGSEELWRWIASSGCINRRALKLAFRAVHMGLGANYCGREDVRKTLAAGALNTAEGVVQALANVVACVRADEGFRMVRLPSAPKPPLACYSIRCAGCHPYWLASVAPRSTCHCWRTRSHTRTCAVAFPAAPQA